MNLTWPRFQVSIKKRSRRRSNAPPKHPQKHGSNIKRKVEKQSEKKSKKTGDRLHIRQIKEFTTRSSPDEIYSHFNTFKFAIIRNAVPLTGKLCNWFSFSDVGSLYRENEKFKQIIESSWSVENKGTFPNNDKLSPSEVLAADSNAFLREKRDEKSSFYTSCILQSNAHLCKQVQETMLPIQSLPTYFAYLGRKYSRRSTDPFGNDDEEEEEDEEDDEEDEEDGDDDVDPFYAGQWKSVTEGDATWLFFGFHTGDLRDKDNDQAPDQQVPLRGRAEHTDSVTHSGTYHVQMSGSKTWYIHPMAESPDWQGKAPKLKDNLDGHAGDFIRGGGQELANEGDSQRRRFIYHRHKMLVA